ncbi:ABC transporter ATP-binding protein [Clostridium felsineum]|uniref:Lipid A export ATP-binding/permease protein MsbA n=1 Tax=Clostridium felsineum TaxID=36839 RepID=A0A1S8LIJ0_9CLOT|nr:ABC transporter ATP-binding protein [Clostridium felsineum]URZ09329.1 Lipid A export ATP-binding/permease protein MsbA [Clostridium felsineum]URZ14015.1 Lipid A export ATP-binding/permease protein MsbA [Clostridium felsineum]
MKYYILKNKLWLFIAVLVRVLGSVIQVFVALVIQQLVDNASNHNMIKFLNWVLFSIVYFSIIGIVNYLSGITQGIYIKKTLINLKDDIFKGILSKNHIAFNKNNTAEYISNLTNDINLVENNYIVTYLMMISDIVVFITTTAVLLSINLWITVALFLTGALMLIVPTTFGKLVAKRQYIVSSSLSSFTTKIKDILEGYEVVKSYNLQNVSIKDFTNENTLLEVSKFKSTYITTISNAVSLLLAISSQILGIALAGYFVINGNLTVGGLLAVVQLGNGIQNPIMCIIQRVTMIRGMHSVNEKLVHIINEIKNTPDSQKIVNEFNNEISLKTVSFSYDKTNTILNNITYSFKKGKKYAIVGKSGCGKTTLLKLLLGYYSNYIGNIYIDGLEIKKLDINSLNRLISIIHQDVYMFDKSIEFNILLNKQFEEYQIKTALNLSGVDKFLDKLPSGIKTIVGEHGKSLSGGQKQRIAIARALIENTPILMLDEGTSALDVQTAFDIENTLLEINDLTVITVTHKLSDILLPKYDEIIVIDNGQIIEKGTFKDLIAQKKYFYQLYKLDHDETCNTNTEYMEIIKMH